MTIEAVVHIGTGKAGSTSIQDSLFASRKELLAGGVLVPTHDGKRLDQAMTRDLLTGEGSPQANADAAKSIDAQIEKYNPRYVIFSSEYLWNRGHFVDRIRPNMARWTGNLKILLYLRDPAQYYLSAQQQRLKAQGEIPGPATWRASYRTCIKLWRNSFGRDLAIIPFQPSSFGQCLVRDLVQRFFRDANIESEHLTIESVYASEIAEVSCIMQDYFLALHSGEAREWRREAIIVRRTLNEIALRNSIGHKAKLKPEVRETILRNHHEELDWLMNEEGIVFDSIDYDALGRYSSPSNPVQKEQRCDARFSDLVEIDQAAVEMLQKAALRELATRFDQERRKSKRRRVE